MSHAKEASPALPTRRTWLACLLGMAASVQAGPRLAAVAAAPVAAGSPEFRLIQVYRAIRADRLDQALKLAEALTRDVPQFQLGQLVYGDLLMARRGQLAGFGAVPSTLGASGADQLRQLRDEAHQRLALLTEEPPAGHVPRQVLELGDSVRHLVAVDASRSRVYVLQHDGGDTYRLVFNEYASVGRLGTDKQAEGDQRTPLGIYFITSRLDDTQIDDFYGVGALPINYPNEFDRRMGKTGGGIWLHGVPSSVYSRGPNTTDGCVALSNDDMAQLLRMLEPRRTPVVIAQQLEWVRPQELAAARDQFRAQLERWREARSAGNEAAAIGYYSAQFQNGSADLAQWRALNARDMAKFKGKHILLKDVSILAWKHKSEIMVVTFGEVREGSLGGVVKRQYWGKENGQWKIFFEGVVG